MANELAGKVAIITGGAAGIGEATVRLFVAEGAKVVCADVQDERGQKLADSLGPNCRYKHCDVSKKEEVQALVDFAVSAFGGLHIMNNNAGIGDPNGAARFLDATFDGFHKVIDVNLLGVIWGSQCAARHMKDHGGGSIINTASIAGTRPGHGVFTYRAAKAGVINFTQSIAMDLGEYLIRCNVICPGNIPTEIGIYNTPGMDSATAERVRNAVKQVRMDRQPLKSQGEGVDIANAALFLGSDRSRQVTGLVLPVDAGATAGDHVDLGTKIREARETALRG
jgi:NAD(P)-dependent dehydrogenase (short-subunit alcohol dehydrogenase family)